VDTITTHVLVLQRKNSAIQENTSDECSRPNNNLRNSREAFSYNGGALRRCRVGMRSSSEFARADGVKLTVGERRRESQSLVTAYLDQIHCPSDIAKLPILLL